ncbi:MAG: holo-ACP synthase [Christensenellales bacterium]|nr:holo-ACP synthase [Christensenellales bacterium]
MPEIIGIGTDLCAVSRMERAIAKAHFYERVFLDGERTYLADRGRARAQSAAAMFAAKEAVAKALGTGFSSGVTAWSVEVTHDERGAPGVCLHDGALARLKEIGGGRVLLSLTHEGDMAMAFAVIEGKTDC